MPIDLQPPLTSLNPIYPTQGLNPPNMNQQQVVAKFTPLAVQYVNSVQPMEAILLTSAKGVRTLAAKVMTVSNELATLMVYLTPDAQAAALGEKIYHLSKYGK